METSCTKNRCCLGGMTIEWRRTDAIIRNGFITRQLKLRTADGRDCSIGWAGKVCTWKGKCLDATHLPTKFSNTELFPALWPPTTAICGRSNCICTPSWVNASCNLLTIGISCSKPGFPAILTAGVQDTSLEHSRLWTEI